jgi:hypothetical protein
MRVEQPMRGRVDFGLVVVTWRRKDDKYSQVPTRSRSAGHKVTEPRKALGTGSVSSALQGGSSWTASKDVFPRSMRSWEHVTAIDEKAGPNREECQSAGIRTNGAGRSTRGPSLAVLHPRVEALLLPATASTTISPINTSPLRPP